MKKNILALATITSIFFSCNPEEDNNNNGNNNNENNDNGNNTEKIYLPTKLTVIDDENYTDTYTFTYDSSNRLIQQNITKEGSTKISEITYTYNNNILTGYTEKSTLNNGTQTTDHITFTIQNNTITARENGELEFSFTINDKGQIVSIPNSENITFTYDANGNLITQESTEEKNTYSYDNKNGIFKNMAIQPWAKMIIMEELIPFYNINNATKLHHWDKIENAEETINVNLNYNSANYPTKMTFITNSQIISKVEIEYLTK